jgi:membrane dipeptidase
MGIEGSHQIGNSASVLRMYHRLGVRYMTLTHDSNTLYADSATAATQPHGGLSKDGRALIREMNRIGMYEDFLLDFCRFRLTSHDDIQDRRSLPHK